MDRRTPDTDIRFATLSYKGFKGRDYLLFVTYLVCLFCNPVKSMSCHPFNNNVVVVGGWDTLSLFDIRKPLKPLIEIYEDREVGIDYPIKTVEWSPSGCQFVACGDTFLEIHQFRSGVAYYDSGYEDNRARYCGSVWADDEKSILTADSRGKIVIWNKITHNKVIKDYSYLHGGSKLFLAFNQRKRNMGVGFSGEIGILSHE